MVVVAGSSRTCYTGRVPSRDDSHRDVIRDQFTKQAVPFATAPPIKDADALARLVAFAGAGPDDTVLDVACGPGLVVCAFAAVVRHATGIDLTPAMLEQARALQHERGVTNVTWQLGDVGALPFPDDSFTIVVSRFALHHMLDPRAIVAEMVRVCAPGGTVVINDLTGSEDPVKAAAFHAMEILRDPSHARSLPLTELRALFTDTGLPEPTVELGRNKIELEALLERSFPAPGDVATIRAMFEASLADDGLGMKTYRKDGQIRGAFATAMLCASKPAHGRAGGHEAGA